MPENRVGWIWSPKIIIKNEGSPGFPASPCPASPRSRSSGARCASSRSNFKVMPVVETPKSPYAQFVELDLSRFDGQIPVELFGPTHFPRIGQLPYFITLGPYGYFWFRLQADEREEGIASLQPLLRATLAAARLLEPDERLDHGLQLIAGDSGAAVADLKRAEAGQPTVLRLIDMQQIDRARCGRRHHIGQLAVQHGKSARRDGRIVVDAAASVASAVRRHVNVAARSRPRSASRLASAGSPRRRPTASRMLSASVAIPVPTMPRGSNRARNCSSGARPGCTTFTATSPDGPAAR